MTSVCPEIDWYPLDSVSGLIGYSKPTMRRWAQKLRAEKVEEFDHEPNEPVITNQSFRVYQRLAELRNQKVPVNKAIEFIRIQGI